MQSRKILATARPNQFFDVGERGRKTGWRPDANIRKDEDGMDDLEEYFNSPVPNVVYERSVRTEYTPGRPANIISRPLISRTPHQTVQRVTRDYYPDDPRRGYVDQEILVQEPGYVYEDALDYPNSSYQVVNTRIERPIREQVLIRNGAEFRTPGRLQEYRDMPVATTPRYVSSREPRSEPSVRYSMGYPPAYPSSTSKLTGRKSSSVPSHLRYNSDPFEDVKESVGCLKPKSRKSKVPKPSKEDEETLASGVLSADISEEEEEPLRKRLGMVPRTAPQPGSNSRRQSTKKPKPVLEEDTQTTKKPKSNSQNKDEESGSESGEDTKKVSTKKSKKAILDPLESVSVTDSEGEVPRKSKKSIPSTETSVSESLSEIEKVVPKEKSKKSVPIVAESEQGNEENKKVPKSVKKSKASTSEKIVAKEKKKSVKKPRKSIPKNVEVVVSSVEEPNSVDTERTNSRQDEEVVGDIEGSAEANQPTQSQQSVDDMSNNHIEESFDAPPPMEDDIPENLDFTNLGNSNADDQNEQSPESDKKEDNSSNEKSTGKPTKKRARKEPVPKKVKKEKVERFDFKEYLKDEEDDSNRRSKRTRVAPLAFWKNEKVVFGRRESGVGPLKLGIQEVIRVPSDDEAKFVKPKSKPKPRVKKEELPPPPEKLPVINYLTKQVEQQKIAVTPEMIQIKRKVGSGDYSFQKVFSEGDFLGSGVLDLPKGSQKPSKNSHGSAMIFVVLEGMVKVQVHESTFSLGQGGQFFVPRGISD